MLTETATRKARPKEKQYKLFDERGLFLLVTPQGAKYWRLKYRIEGREKGLSLGVYPDVPLKDAREKRDEFRKLIAAGVDPSEQRQASKQARANTLEAIALEWLSNQKAKFAPATHSKAEGQLKSIFPYLGFLPINEVTAPRLLDVLRRIENQGKHETAHRVRQRLSQVFRYAIATGRCERDPTQDLRGALKPVVTTSRAAITDPRKVAELLRAIDSYSGFPATCYAMKLLPLTFVRPGELRLARWPELDLDNAVWRIPAERMKMNREHIVPLSRQAVDLFRDLLPLTGHRAYVFESARPGRPLSDNTVNYALRGLGYAGDVMTAHGFRAMASTLLHEQGWPPEVIELQLAHAQRNQVAAAYNRSARLDERKKMMQHWADYLDSLRQGAKVVNFRGV